MNEGDVVSSTGLAIAVEDYEQHFAEQQVAHSTALASVRLPGGAPYLVGPLARLNNCFDQLAPTAQRELAAAGIALPLRNNFQSILARLAEAIHAFDEAARIVADYQADLSPSRIEFEPRAGEGCHATEAPRGLLYHRYRIGDDGLIAEAKIVPPTSQNQGQIELDLKEFVPSVAELDDATLTARCEQLIRNYDPCISCATHFLQLDVERSR